MDGEKFSMMPDYVWYYLLAESEEAEHEGLVEQAWQYATEFSPDYME